MAKPTSQERRKQTLRQRRAEEQREYDRQVAGYFFGDAVRAHRSGDIPAAGRYLKRALILDPDHARAIELLAQIHQAAGHYAEALGYMQRLRKVDTNPRAIYNIAVLHHHLGQGVKAIETMREFHRTARGPRPPHLSHHQLEHVDLVVQHAQSLLFDGARSGSN
jgi:Tfp pilus assembly protein PilF